MPTNIAKPYKISVIAAIGRKRELGKDNKLIWSIPDDLRHFKTTTTGHPIIMGLNTYNSIGHPLPNRTNIVLSNIPVDPIPGVTIVGSIEEAIQKGAKAQGGEEMFFSGGGMIYKQIVPLADKLYLTLIDAEAEADTFFPDYSIFTKIISEKKHSTKNGLKYTYVELEK